MSKTIEVIEKIKILGKEISREQAKEIWEELNVIFGEKHSLPYFPPGVREWEIPPVTCDPITSPYIYPWKITYSDETV